MGGEARHVCQSGVKSIVDASTRSGASPMAVGQPDGVSHVVGEVHEVPPQGAIDPAGYSNDGRTVDVPTPRGRRIDRHERVRGQAPDKDVRRRLLDDKTARGRRAHRKCEQGGAENQEPHHFVCRYRAIVHRVNTTAAALSNSIPLASAVVKPKLSVDAHRAASLRSRAMRNRGNVALMATTRPRTMYAQTSGMPSLRDSMIMRAKSGS